MSSVVRRRVISPILTTHKNGFVTVPAGSIIDPLEHLHEPGLHTILLASEELLALTRDIEERTENIDPPANREEAVAAELSGLHYRRQ